MSSDTPTAFRAVLFDMDGVLVDSYGPHFESWRDVAREYGCEMSEADFRATFGRTSRDIVAHFFGERLSPAQAEELDQRKEARYREIVAGRFPWMPGARELIESLHAAGVRMAIGSSGPPENVALLLQQLDRPGWIEAQVTGRDVTRGKPDPQVFLLAAERLGALAAECAVIEDAPAGIEAARRAGAVAVGLAADEERAQALAEAGAHHVVRSLHELDLAALSALHLRIQGLGPRSSRGPASSFGQRLLSVLLPILLSVPLLSAGFSGEPVRPDDDAVAPAIDPLAVDLGSILEGVDGVVGISALHLESGRRFEWNAHERFPMASTFKLAIAVTLLRQVRSGSLALSERVAIGRGDLHPGSGTLEREFTGPGTSLSVRALLERMLTVSDNSATDLLLRRVGGPEAVTATLREIGIEEMRVDRSTLRIICDWAGVEDVPADERLEPEVFLERYHAVDEETRDRALRDFDQDPRDTSTPAAMCRLLRGILVDESVLDEEGRTLLLSLMDRCETGERRLRGRLPPGTPVAHKTGTIGGATHDVGVITLPGGRGRLLVAAFVKESGDPVEEREAVIAAITRKVFDACAALDEGSELR